MQSPDTTEIRQLIETRFGEFLEFAPDGMLMANARGTLLYLNRRVESLFGYEHGELTGKPLELLLPERFRGMHEHHRTDYFTAPRVRTMGEGKDFLGLRKDGSEFPIEISLSPIRIEGVTLVISAIRDITERKRIERALREKNAELETANRELESFSYSVSHDLRAPLRALGGFVRMLQQQHEGNLPENAVHQLGRIYANAAKMNQLIESLLGFSRLARQPLKRQSVNTNEIVGRALEDFQSERAERDLQIVKSDLPDCQADPVLLQQVFANLLSNAFKYSHGKAPAVVQIGAQNGNRICTYFVKDNGVGFSMEYSSKLFGVFQRLHCEDEFEGVGAGLAIVQRIVHRHGGRIWAEAKPGEGATFYFTLAAAGGE